MLVGQGQVVVVGVIRAKGRMVVVVVAVAMILSTIAGERLAGRLHHVWTADTLAPPPEITWIRARRA